MGTNVYHGTPARVYAGGAFTYDPTAMAPTIGLFHGLGHVPFAGRAAAALPYIVGTAAVAAVLLLKPLTGLSIGDEAATLLAIGAVLLAAVAGGWRPGIFAAALSLAGIIAFYPPSGDGSRLTWGNLGFGIAFVAEAGLVITLAEYARQLLRRIRREAAGQAALAEIAELALANRDEYSLFEHAAERIADYLAADAAVVFIQDGNGPGLAARWPADAQVPPGDDPGYLALAATCVTPGVTTLASENWTDAGRFLQSLGYLSGACTPLDGRSEHPAFLAVLWRGETSLRDSERRYLETVAAVLGAARHRRAGEQALERSEERLRVAQAAANVGTWEWDLGTQEMAWSDGLEILHGLPPGTFPKTAGDYLELVHPDDRDAVRTAALEAASGDHRFDARYRIQLPQGQTRWVSARGQVFPATAGNPSRVVGVVSDVSDQVQVEEAVRLSEERFRMLANAAPVLIRVGNPSGACVFVTERWSTFVGRPAQSDLGWGWLECVHPDDREACRQALADSAARRIPAEIEYRVRHANGDYRWMLDRTVPVERPGETLVAFVSSCTDITDRRHAEEALRFAADSGAQLSSSLDYEETLDGLARLAVPRFADWCVVFLKGDDGAINRVSVVHRDPERAEAVDQLTHLEALDPGGDTVAARIIRTAEPLLASTVDPARLPVHAYNDEHLELLRQLGLRSLLGVPVIIHGEAVGAIVFLRGESGRNFQDTDITLALDLARRASVSIENARLYSDLVERESAVARANETLTFLLDASAELARTLDLDEMMARLAALATPRVADWCVILSLDADGKPLTRAASHRDPRWSERTRELQERYPFNPGADGAIMRALLEGKPAFFPAINEDLLRAGANNDEHFSLIRRLGLRSAVIVPLAGTSTSYGAMYFVMSDSGRHYTEDDFATLQDLAHRAAIAMDNATLFREAQHREQDLRRANEAKDEFLGMMSHELRTPLTIINGGARVLRARSKELDDESRASILGDIESESDRLFRMVENLLSLAHLEFGESFEVEPVHAARLSEKVIAAFRTRRPNRQVILDVEPGAETFAAQPVYLEQVIRNLLSNADKYSPQGEPITIQVRRAGEGVGEFRVQDRGVGIDPEEADLIFERFYRSERTSRLVGGSGVGLALCKRLIEAMSGRIWARPRDGGGLEVGFSLPLYEEAFV